MTLTVEYQVSGHTPRTYLELSQREVNNLISHISILNEREYAPVLIKVEDQSHLRCSQFNHREGEQNMDENKVEALKKMTFISACRTFFGPKPGQSLRDFADEVKVLDQKDRADMIEGFKTVGIDATLTAQLAAEVARLHRRNTDSTGQLSESITHGNVRDGGEN